MKTRDRIIKVRFSDAEYEKATRRAELTGLPFATYLRKQGLHGSVPNVDAIRERTGFLNRWNANLNMIARWCNIHKSNSDAVEVKAELVALSRLIRRHFQEDDE
mgnify:CR=1 FL=1